MKRLKVGIIGLGRSGSLIHGNYLATQSEKFIITAVTSKAEEERKTAGLSYGCPVYEDYSEMIKNHKFDFVVNTAPNHLHVPITLDLLHNGINVVCEKPLTNNTNDVDTLIKAVEETGCILTVFHNMRFVPSIQQIKKVMDSGVLGRIVQISLSENAFRRRWDSQTLQEFNGGNLSVWGSHLLDQALYLLGTDFTPAVNCALDRANTFGDADDFAKLFLREAGKPVVDIEVSSCCAYPSAAYNIQGTCGGISGNLRQLKWKYFKPEETPKQQLTKTTLVDQRGNPVYCLEELKWYEDSLNISFEDHENGHIGFYDSLYRTFTEDAPLAVTLQQVRQQISIIEQGLRQNPLSKFK